MTRARIFVLGFAGLLLPVALALAAFLISSKVGASADSPAVTEIQRQNAQINDQTSGKGKGTDDHGDRCAEPEHRSDPECSVAATNSPQPTPTVSDDHSGTSGEDSSGKGSGGGGGDDQPSSTPDDRSGSGSGGGSPGDDD